MRQQTRRLVRLVQIDGDPALAQVAGQVLLTASSSPSGGVLRDGMRIRSCTTRMISSRDSASHWRAIVLASMDAPKMPVDERRTTIAISVEARLRPSSYSSIISRRNDVNSSIPSSVTTIPSS